MPWTVSKSDECPADQPYAVIKDSDGSIEGCHATEQDANDQLAALNASEENMTEQNQLHTEIEQRYGTFGGREVRTMPLVVEEVRDSDAGDDSYTVRGHAAVYSRKSLDLGGFQEVIEQGAFDDVLDRDPDVHLLRDHDPGKALARTRSKRYQLELRSDPKGLHYWARVAPTSDAKDLRILMEGGVIDQASFAFTVAAGGERWEIRNEGKNNETVIRTIEKVGELFDVTITAQGAYPQTDSSVVRQRALNYATSTRRLPGLSGAEENPTAAAPDDPADGTDTEAPHADGVDAAEERAAAPAESADSIGHESTDQPPLKDLKREGRETLRAAKQRQLLLERGRIQ